MNNYLLAGALFLTLNSSLCACDSISDDVNFHINHVNFDVEDHGFGIDPYWSMTQRERDFAWKKLHFAIHKTHFYMKKAESSARKITQFNIRRATVAAIEGGIAGLSTRNAYGVVISATLNAFGHIAGESYTHFRQSREYVLEARRFALIADDIQEKLWRDK